MLLDEFDPVHARHFVMLDCPRQWSNLGKELAKLAYGLLVECFVLDTTQPVDPIRDGQAGFGPVCSR
jgi:hypothetical protein